MIARATSPAKDLGRDYLRRAFHVQYNLIFVGGVVLFALAAASPALLFAGLAFEVMWLGIAPNLASTQRWLDQREQYDQPPPPPLRKEAPASVSAPARPALDPAYTHRLTALERTLGEIRKLTSSLDATRLRQANVGLDSVARSFAALCESHQRLAKYVNGHAEPALLAEVERLKSSFSAEKDLGLRLAIRQSIALAQRRVEQRTQIAASLRTTTVRLETLERSVTALLSHARTLGVNQGLLAELDALGKEVASDSTESEPLPSPLAPAYTGDRFVGS